LLIFRTLDVSEAWLDVCCWWSLSIEFCDWIYSLTISCLEREPVSWGCLDDLEDLEDRVETLNFEEASAA